ncbi:two-component sensor histidine kinase [Clostridia bacterium]|nr:two-component sensor histidine kinase [Clostridia bacterium]
MNSGMNPRISVARKILSCLGFLCAYTLAILAARQFLSLFVAVPSAGLCILTGIGALIILSVVFGSIMSLFRRSNIHEIQDMHGKLTSTLREIANGNFNVFVETDPRGPHNDIAEAMNEMTRKLGTLENMRQDFISNVSHEFQSPLTSIGGFARLLKDDGLPPDQRLHYLEIIEAESRRLSSLSDNLLKLSTLDNNKIPLNRTEFRLDKQLQQIALTLEPQWSAKHIELGADLDVKTISADKELMSQVWMNLLVNAIKFTPEYGSINITLKDDAVTIADTGCGISQDDRLHIFERFYKVDKARDRSLGGNGLGLSIVRKILDLHGFGIDVESEPGKGAQFTIRLS